MAEAAGNHGACGARTAQEGIGQPDEGWNPDEPSVGSRALSMSWQNSKKFSPLFHHHFPNSRTCYGRGQCLLYHPVIKDGVLENGPFIDLVR